MEQQLELNLEVSKKRYFNWTLKNVQRMLETNRKARIKAFFKLFGWTERHKIDDRGFHRFDYPRALAAWKNYKLFGEFTPDDLYTIDRIVPKYYRQIYQNCKLKED